MCPYHAIRIKIFYVGAAMKLEAWKCSNVKELQTEPPEKSINLIQALHFNALNRISFLFFLRTFDKLCNAMEKALRNIGTLKPRDWVFCHKNIHCNHSMDEMDSYDEWFGHTCVQWKKIFFIYWNINLSCFCRILLTRFVCFELHLPFPLPNDYELFVYSRMNLLLFQ